MERHFVSTTPIDGVHLVIDTDPQYDRDGQLIVDDPPDGYVEITAEDFAALEIDPDQPGAVLRAVGMRFSEIHDYVLGRAGYGTKER